MEKLELQVQLRETKGKSAARQMRFQKMIPAVFYGPHMDQPISISIATADMGRLKKKGSNVLLNLKAQGVSKVDGKMALLKEDQVDPITGNFLHADLVEIRLDESIRVSVPIILTGKSKGVVEGGIMEQIRRELEVRCLPDRIPESITADVTNIDVGESMHVSDITLPEGIEFMGNKDFTIAAVTAPPEEEVAPVEVLAEGEEAAEGAEAVDGEAPAEGEAKPAAEGEAKPAAEGEAAKKTE